MRARTHIYTTNIIIIYGNIYDMNLGNHWGDRGSLGNRHCIDNDMQSHPPSPGVCYCLRIGKRVGPDDHYHF